MEIQEEEIKLEFLVCGSYDVLPSSYYKLRSYLNIYSSNLASLHGLKLPKCFARTNLICRQCFLPWSCDTYSIKLLPVKKLSKSFSRTKRDSTKTSLKLKVRRNHLVLKCKICNSKSHFYLPKIVKTSKRIIKDEIMVKRKKKKNNLHGLQKFLKTSFNKCEPFGSNRSKTNSSTSRPNKASSPTTKNKNSKLKNAKVKNDELMPKVPATHSKTQKTNKNLRVKPSDVKPQRKSSNMKKNNLQKLKKMIQRENAPIKKTLKDFLTLI